MLKFKIIGRTIDNRQIEEYKVGQKEGEIQRQKDRQTDYVHRLIGQQICRCNRDTDKRIDRYLNISYVMQDD